ncbi:MAG: hypothetical protein ACRDP1_16360 [Nocardioidaceae bacterium]
MGAEDEGRATTPTQHEALEHSGDPAVRAKLIAALSGMSAHEINRRRHRLVALVTFCCVALVPWVVVLSLTLPRRQSVHNWRGVWVGYDLLEVLVLGLTAYLGWRGRQLVLLSATVAGTLLLADAWFDVMTADRGSRLGSLLMSVLIEIPLALLLWHGAWTLVRLSSSAPDAPVHTGFRAMWRLPIVPLADEVMSESDRAAGDDAGGKGR